MDERIEAFLADVLAPEGENDNAIREGVRVALDPNSGTGIPRCAVLKPCSATANNLLHTPNRLSPEARAIPSAASGTCT
jgi:hypothetical protein